MRHEDSNGKYILDQRNFIGTLERMWGDSRADDKPHHNDRVRVYGLIMTRPENREMYQRLAEGVTNRKHLDDPSLGLKQLFQNVALEFSNEEVMVELTEEAMYLSGIQDIDPNDRSRMRANRDCKFISIYTMYCIYM